MLLQQPLPYPLLLNPWQPLSVLLLRLEKEWTSEARRYYINIVGKYGAQVQAVLKKTENLEIRNGLALSEI